MGFISEFKEFASKGNVMDLAVGVVIGAAFGKIVASFVEDVLMPPLGIIIGGVDFKHLKIPLKSAVMENGKVISEAVTLNYGNFIQTLVDFLIIAFAIFLLIKGINRLKRKKVESVAAQEVIKKLTHEEELLTQIRDLLAERPRV
ncbi:large-conductance mechanosensitive channel protein MscL [Adhaeribacter sp. BT258]|uniref:Large-conductance mechanosensitive channel n=1 Tax=Adhaeribacter terrigena TaxID=2793070 RepID=A0ABS1BWU0_9BACT|nr:large-conductance mechanosensitive channel protein MscL [Adhaeribacter terrigena]MBK0401599.1 large-conductance mechanosensitive channel protein MscL [Adhaeribacter terrigena]